MNKRTRMIRRSGLLLGLCLLLPGLNTQANDTRHILEIAAKNSQERSALANIGVSIERANADTVWAIATEKEIELVKQNHFKIINNYPIDPARGQWSPFDFPSEDSRFHNYAEITAEMQKLASENPSLVALNEIGQSVQGKKLYALHFNSDATALASGQSTKPGVAFLGNHHAREHVSAEIPLMLAQYLVQNAKSPEIANLLSTRDIWIVPMVNPDGVEWDISTGNYKMWRKNRAQNGGSSMGVDLNRNYGYGWGGGGASTDPNSETFRGPNAFSEPETQAIKKFVEDRPNFKVLLSFHTFSELVLYPWGHTNDAIEQQDDRQVFETMARTMAQWNGYKPEQSSDLYIASGDTTDWAYGEHRIFAFTFELSPKSMWDGGFYPGARVIDRVFQANLKPCLYMMDVADNPYKVIKNQPSKWLPSLGEPSINYASFWN